MAAHKLIAFIHDQLRCVASVNTDVLTGQSGNGLTQNWDTQQLVDGMRANLEITEAFTRDLGTFAANQSKELNDARKELETATDPQRRQELQQYILTQEEFFREFGTYQK